MFYYVVKLLSSEVEHFSKMYLISFMFSLMFYRVLATKKRNNIKGAFCFHKCFVTFLTTIINANFFGLSLQKPSYFM